VKERLVICNVEDMDGRARVTRDEERVIPVDYNTIQYNIRLIRLVKTQTIQYMVIKISQ